MEPIHKESHKVIGISGPPHQTPRAPSRWEIILNCECGIGLYQRFSSEVEATQVIQKWALKISETDTKE